ncbi:hypothetical protein BDQ17DRAFT_1363501 [Cyathus striatus]|nr:hypothetical protein BDQ17DRAFT_1363501 [Cyathus striatus]
MHSHWPRVLRILFRLREAGTGDLGAGGAAFERCSSFFLLFHLFPSPCLGPSCPSLFFIHEANELYSVYPCQRLLGWGDW